MNRKEERHSKSKTPVYVSKPKEDKGSKTGSFNITSNFTEMSRKHIVNKNQFELQFDNLLTLHEEGKWKKQSPIESLKQSKKKDKDKEKDKQRDRERQRERQKQRQKDRHREKGKTRQHKQLLLTDKQITNPYEQIYLSDLRYLAQYKQNTGRYENCGPSLQWPYLFTEYKPNH